MSSELRKWLNGWTLLALLPIALHLAATFAARNPNVSDAYYAYYIDRSSDLPVWVTESDQTELPPLKPGQVYTDKSPEVVLLGWSGHEPTHTWSLGKNAHIIFSLADEATDTEGLTLRLKGFYFSGTQRIRLSLDDTTLDGTYSDGQAIEFPLPPGVGDRKLIHISLSLPDAAPASDRDPRVLGFALQKVTVTQKQ
jgi:hypothetical protein